MPLEWQHDGFTVSTDPARLDVSAIHASLSASYWAKGIPRDVLERAITHSLPFGIYEGVRQVGFARMVTDRATVGYLADVYVLEEFRGRGLSRFLMRCVLEHPELQGFRRSFLVTRDAHGLYAKFGFTPLAAPERWLEKSTPDVYAQASKPA